ncbi:MAG: ribonuclease P protein component [Oscillospiraceae bacterium]|nr:ribonuclease P protein component [Oscillospiraceae bacterium]
MKKIQRIKQNSQFKRLYQKGQSLVSPCLVCYIRKNSTGEVKLGLTVSKKIGGAVERNRAKRVMRVAARAAVAAGLSGADMLLVARGKTPFVKSTRVESELLSSLERAGFVNRGEGAK